jgi:hypothetical protein
MLYSLPTELLEEILTAALGVEHLRETLPGLSAEFTRLKGMLSRAHCLTARKDAIASWALNPQGCQPPNPDSPALVDYKSSEPRP